jgi:hypothetical protein
VGWEEFRITTKHENQDANSRLLPSAQGPWGYNHAHTPLTVFDVKGIPGHRRDRIEAAVRCV